MEALQVLVEIGRADIFGVDAKGRFALSYACMAGDDASVGYLLEDRGIYIYIYIYRGVNASYRQSMSNQCRHVYHIAILPTLQQPNVLLEHFYHIKI
jgi:hypothetical protein